MMSHLSIRTTSEDEHRLTQLCEIFGLDRSDATREALKIALKFVHESKDHDRLAIINESKFIGGGKTKAPTRVFHKSSLKEKLKKKYGKKK